MDPESGLDAIRDVGITGSRITAISTARLQGKIEVDAAGLVVAPGFIDLHQHGHDLENYRYKAMDGVTTALELEVGVLSINEWYSAREGKALINYGASAGPMPLRTAMMKDTGASSPRRDTALDSASLQESVEAAVQKQLDEGALGMGLFIESSPEMTREEILHLFYAVAKWKRPVFIHLRKPGALVIESLQEVIADSVAAGVPIHVMHIAGSAGKRTSEALRMIEGARAHGVDVTTETYPYIAGGAYIESALFDPGWQENRGITYSDLMWVATGERLTQESFERYRKQGGSVMMFVNTEDTLRKAIADPLVMIASDGAIHNGQGHPRGAGSYARVLGKYVRED
jgi:N-acyl-D-aspartate/D-glutamate deacylase